MRLVEDTDRGCDHLLDDEDLACRLALAMANCQFKEAGISTYRCMPLPGLASTITPPGGRFF
jgi:hypothetical protein